MLRLAPNGRRVPRLDACREVVRAFHWRSRLVADAAKHAGLTEELAENILTFIGLTQDALVHEIWNLARWMRVACTSRTYMEERISSSRIGNVGACATALGCLCAGRGQSSSTSVQASL